MYPVYSNELYHHGIKGQKWGVRRYRNEDGTLTAAGKKRARMSDDARDAKALRKKKLHELSNDDIRKLNERNRLENEYYQNKPSKLKRATASVAKVTAALASVAALSVALKNVRNEGKSVINRLKPILQKLPMPDVKDFVNDVKHKPLF